MQHATNSIFLYFYPKKSNVIIFTGQLVATLKSQNELTPHCIEKNLILA